jgi:hypothetical protein
MKTVVVEAGQAKPSEWSRSFDGGGGFGVDEER